ncbi:hypothetical protein TNCV_912341 [Trichonephila clavipes]|nr:hypothetical protein TNCV_912341 [Trichonephila clavipes]
MANRINLSHADIAKLIEASDSEEVYKYENPTSDEIERASSDNDFDTNNQQMNYKESIQSKIPEIKWKLNPLPHSSQSTAAKIIKKLLQGSQDLQRQGRGISGSASHPTEKGDAFPTPGRRQCTHKYIMVWDVFGISAFWGVMDREKISLR